MTELTEEAKETRRQYHREWNRKNKDRVREHQNRYWIRRFERLQKAAAAAASATATGAAVEV